jgi:hypothetical protein
MARRKIFTVKYLSENSDAFFDALNGEDDLPMVLVGSSYLDACVASLLKTAFAEGDSANVLLNGALASFAARIDACHALRLITDAMRSDLISIAQIRNRFAHDPFASNFADPEVERLCGTLGFGWKPSTGPDTFERVKKGPPKAQFMLSAGLLSQRLLVDALSRTGSSEDTSRPIGAPVRSGTPAKPSKP